MEKLVENAKSALLLAFLFFFGYLGYLKIFQSEKAEEACAKPRTVVEVGGCNALGSCSARLNDGTKWEGDKPVIGQSVCLVKMLVPKNLDDCGGDCRDYIRFTNWFFALVGD